MIQTLAILWNACGAAGLLSAVASCLAVVMLGAGIAARGRFRAWLAAAAIAAAAVGLAVLTSWSVRSIEVDRSAEVIAAEAAGVKAAREKLRGRAANIRFAEDTAIDQADVAGVTAAEEEGAYERAMAAELEKIPAYRRGGRKDRSGRRPATTDGGAADDASAEAGKGDAEASEIPGRRLPEADLRVADRFDRINRGLAWTLLSTAVGLVGYEWVRRFNTTFDAVWPLPLAGSPIDGATAKAHVASPPPGLGLAGFLAAAVRKGESFVAFTEGDPLAGRGRLDRLAAGPLAWSLPVRSCGSRELVDDPKLAEIVFETAWFGRGAFVCEGPDAGPVLRAFADALDGRRHCRARARRTLNLVWALPTPPDAALVERIERLAAATNVRWILGAWS